MEGTGGGDVKEWRERYNYYIEKVSVSVSEVIMGLQMILYDCDNDDVIERGGI